MSEFLTYSGQVWCEAVCSTHVQLFTLYNTGQVSIIRSQAAAIQHTTKVCYSVLGSPIHKLLILLLMIFNYLQMVDS